MIRLLILDAQAVGWRTVWGLALTVKAIAADRMTLAADRAMAIRRWQGWST